MRKFYVYLENNEKVYLTEHDLSNSGGEGEIFIKDNFAYKIYFDPKKVISLDKIKELSLLDRDNIVRPIQPIRNEKGQYIGYQMNAIFPDKCYPLTRFFTTDFRNQHNISNDDVINIIRELYFTFDFIHQKDFLIVDGNEMNFLVSDDFKTIYFIDVDSYKTPSFKPTAFNPNTLDPLIKNNEFTKESDWYIFAILFCQIVLGIHPFKGKYTGTSLSFGKRDLTKRMKLGVSILNPKVKLNKAVRSLSLIPNEMRKWLDAIFKNEHRVKPPLLPASTKLAQKIVDIFDIPSGFKVLEGLSLLKEVEEIFKVGDSIFFKRKNAYVNEEGTAISGLNNFAFNIGKKLAFAKLDNKKLLVFVPELNITTEIYHDIESVYSFNGELFIYKNNKLSNLDIMIIGNKLVAGILNTWDLYYHQSINNFILFYQSGKRKAYYFYEKNKNAIIDLDKDLKKDEKIVNIKGFQNYIVLKTVCNHEYFTKIIFIDLFSKNTTLIFEEHSETTDINFVLNKGLLIGEIGDEKLLIGLFKESKFNNKIIENFTLNKKLISYNEQISFVDKDKVYHLTMEK